MAARKTRGFASHTHLLSHFGDHASDFSVSTLMEYEELADHFLSKPSTPDMHECPRKQGDKVRFDKKTNEFGVIGSDGVIRTYFIPKKCSMVPKVIPRIKCHKFATNLEYAKSQCNSIFTI
jgi:pyocin large subunit-like protein